MNQPLFDYSKLPYKDMALTKEATILFLRNYNNMEFWSVLIAINIANSLDEQPICLSVLGEKLFFTDTRLSIAKDTLSIVKKRITVEKDLVKAQIEYYKEKLKQAELMSNYQRTEKIGEKIAKLQRRKFPSPDVVSEISKQQKVVNQIELERNTIIEQLIKRANIIRRFENG